MTPKIIQQQLQRQILAPIMQKSITVLLLPIMELNTAIEQELQNNPLLEIDEASRAAMQSRDDELRLKIKRITDITDGPYYSPTMGDEENPKEKPITKAKTLSEHLMRQLQFEASDPLWLKIGEQIIGNLDKDGFFTSTCEDVSQRLGIEDPRIAQEVLKLIQSFDPAGIASRDFIECLQTQAWLSTCENLDLVQKIIEYHIKDLGKKRYKKIAKELGAPVDDIKKAAHFISTLDPKPARSYQPIDGNIYVKPDIVIRKIDDKFQLAVNNDDIPPLRISPFYQKLLNRRNLTKEERDFIEERLQSAINFIKSIKQRGETLRAIVQFILKKQGDFFELGHNALVPLTLGDVAKEIDRNESTVSRAIRNKYVDSPQGTYPLRFFFSSAVATQANGNVASRGVKEEIWEMITSEDKASPLSDQEIQKRFKEKGIMIARRTVAKYRNELKIPPSHLRKE